MAYVTIELFRNDFKLNHWENFEKGYSTLGKHGLKSIKLLQQFLYSDDVFIKLHGGNTYLKRNGKEY